MATYKDVIHRFIAQRYQKEAKDLKAGNYATAGGGLFLFGNMIAQHKDDETNCDYRGPYSESRTTKKALSYLRLQLSLARGFKEQRDLFKEDY